MSKKPFWNRWEPFIPLEALEEFKVEHLKSNITNKEIHVEAADYDHVTMYKNKTSQCRRKMSCNCKNCLANNPSEVKLVENEGAKPKLGVSPNHKKENIYDSKGFTVLENNLSLSTLKQNKTQNNDEFQKIIDNVAANTAYCNEIMKAEMDKLGIQNLTPEDSKKVPKLKKDILTATTKVVETVEGEHKHQETQKDETNEKPKRSDPKTTKHKKLIIILEPENEDKIIPKRNISQNSESKREDENSSSQNLNVERDFDDDDVKQIMLMFQLMDARKKYKKIQHTLKHIKVTETQKEFIDLQIKMLKVQMEIQTIKRQMC